MKYTLHITKRILFTLAISLSTAFSADLRMWTDTDGTRFEGTFDKELFGDLLIRDKKGKKHFLPIDQLSKTDADYIQHHVPPAIESKVSYKTRVLPKMTWSRPDDDTTMYTFTVKLTKTSTLPYKGRLTAELFVIADERAKETEEHYVLMARPISKFVFPEGKESSHEFTTSEISFNFYTANWVEIASAKDRGKIYRGYILTVSDQEGNVIYYDTTIRDIEWLTEDIPHAAEELRNLYVNHSGSPESRHFDDFFSKIDPPRIPWFKRTVKW